MTTKKIYKILDITLPIFTTLLIFAIYAIVSKAVGVELIAPSLGSVFKEFFALLGDVDFYKAALGTLARAALAYILSFGVATVLALLTKLCRPLKKSFAQIVAVIRVLPTISLILLTLIWFNSFQATVAVAFCVIFPMLYTCMCGAMDSVDKDLLQMAKVYKIDKKRLIFRIYIPQMTPTLFTGIKSSIGLNLKLVIAAEVLAQTAESMGLYMQLAKINLDTASLLAWTLVAVVMGALVEGLVAIIEKRTVKWL